MSVKGWEGAVRVATTEGGLGTAANEAKVQSVSVSHGPNIESLYEVGSRLPQEVKEGRIEIGLDIEVRYVSGSAWPGRAGVGATGAHTEYYVGIYPKGYATGNPKIVLLGKFGNWALSVPVDGVLTESVSFMGKTVSVGTI